MGYEEDYKYYLTFQRRELQALCRNNRLPANRSHTELANLLALFYEKRNHALSLSRERTINGSHKKPKDAEQLLEHYTDSVGVHGKALPESMSKESDDSQRISTRMPMKIGCDAEFQASANIFALEQSNGSTSLTENCDVVNELKKYSNLRKKRRAATLNHAALKIDNTVPRSKSRAAGSSKHNNFGKDTPSFDFFVESESGLELHVDLNSNPLEWINSLKDEVRNNLNNEDLKPSRRRIHLGSSSVEGSTQLKISQVENIETNPSANRAGIKADRTTSTLSSQNENNKYIMVNADATDTSVLSSSVALSISPIDQKCVASVVDGFAVPISDLCMSSSKEMTDQPQIQSSIPKENHPLKPSGTEVVELTSILSNLEETDDIGKISCQQDLVAKPQEVVTELNGPSNFCEVHLTSTDCLVNSQELGKSTAAEEGKNSECIQYQNSSENYSKSSLTLEAHDNIQIKRRLSNAVEKSEIMVNLRSARTSAEENIVHPRRSSRLLEVKSK